MLISLARVVVVASGLWLVGLAVAAAAAPDRVARFFDLFAGSARAHYTEQLLRLAAGLGFVVYAPEMRFPELFGLFGWVIVGTAVGLLLVPWRWHHRFARWVVPMANRHLWVIALGGLVGGAAILYSAF